MNAGIDRCYVLEKKKDEPGAEFRVQTDGISFEGAFANDDLVDVNQVTCNDVGAVLRTFGVEAARRTIVAEVGGVFGAYGIGVDPRHLSLMSDHMTRQVSPYSSCTAMCTSALTLDCRERIVKPCFSCLAPPYRAGAARPMKGALLL